MTHKSTSADKAIPIVERLTCQVPIESADITKAAQCIETLVEALGAVELARNSDESVDWERATRLTDAALAQVRSND